jgi:hypothetical protein
VWHDGTEKEWGRITAWDPPHRVRYTWYPDRTAESAQDIEVRFERVDSGTRLTLTHTGWERLGKEARKARRGYPIGWAYVMQLYAGKKGPLVVALDLVGLVLRLCSARRGSRRGPVEVCHLRHSSISTPSTISAASFIVSPHIGAILKAAGSSCVRAQASETAASEQTERLAEIGRRLAEVVHELTIR